MSNGEHLRAEDMEEVVFRSNCGTCNHLLGWVPKVQPAPFPGQIYERLLLGNVSHFRKHIARISGQESSGAGSASDLGGNPARVRSDGSSASAAMGDVLTDQSRSAVEQSLHRSVSKRAIKSINFVIFHPGTKECSDGSASSERQCFSMKAYALIKKFNIPAPQKVDGTRGDPLNCETHYICRSTGQLLENTRWEPTICLAKTTKRP